MSFVAYSWPYKELLAAVRKAHKLVAGCAKSDFAGGSAHGQIKQCALASTPFPRVPFPRVPLPRVCGPRVPFPRVCGPRIPTPRIPTPRIRSDVEKPGEAAPGIVDVQHIEQGPGQADVGNLLSDDLSVSVFGQFGIANDHRHEHDFVVQRPLVSFERSVLHELFAVIGGHDDDRTIGQTETLECGEQISELAVGVGDLAVVECDDVREVFGREVGWIVVALDRFDVGFSEE